MLGKSVLEDYDYDRSSPIPTSMHGFRGRLECYWLRLPFPIVKRLFTSTRTVVKVIYLQLGSQVVHYFIGYTAVAYREHGILSSLLEENAQLSQSIDPTSGKCE